MSIYAKVFEKRWRSQKVMWRHTKVKVMDRKSYVSFNLRPFMVIGNDPKRSYQGHEYVQ